MTDSALQHVYDSFWESAEASFARGEVKVDEHLRNRDADRRRGLTVMLRLDDAVAGAVGMFIEQLRHLDPAQYFYTPHQCHVTVLSLRTATSEYVHEPERIAAYADALGEAIQGTPPFAIRFEGVTATPEAVLLRGFPIEDTLLQLRGKIFETMSGRGLPLFLRYAPTTAHVTVMRFSQPGKNLNALTEIVRSNRTRFFGTSAVRQIELVENDWYMSPDRLRPIRAFEL